MAVRAFAGGGTDLQGGSIAGASFHPPGSRFGGPLPPGGELIATGGGGGTSDDTAGPGGGGIVGGCEG